ncbi:ATP-binding protein [Acidobacteriota bacterium]
MRLRFLNREKEQLRLKKLFTSRESTLCCLYGRRRVGKSRLIQETLPAEKAVYFVSDEREPALQRKALSSVIASVLPGFEEVQYPDWPSLFERWWREAPSGSILILDEFPYLVKASPEIPSLLQNSVDRFRERGIHMVLCGSSQRMMQGLVLDAASPLYGRAQEIIHVMPLGIFWTAKALNLKGAIDVLEAYSVWGGIPRYWELAADHVTTWESIENLVLDPMGVLHHEPRRLLLDDIRETAQAGSILALIGSGCNRLSEIAARLSKPSTSLTRPMQRLLELGLIRRDVPFGASEKSSKKTLYSINDPFLSFWFRYVEPNRSRLEAGPIRPIVEKVRQDFRHHVGRTWEGLSRLALPRLQLEGIEWKPAQRWWGAGKNKKPLEFDIISESADSRSLFVGEAKLSIGRNELMACHNSLRRRLDLLPFVSSYSRIETAVFVAETRIRKNANQVVTGREVLTVLK